MIINHHYVVLRGFLYILVKNVPIPVAKVVHLNCLPPELEVMSNARPDDPVGRE